MSSEGSGTVEGNSSIAIDFSVDIGVLQVGSDYPVLIDILSNDPDERLVQLVLNIHVAQASAIENEWSGLPKSLALHQNFPNPFNPVTSIRIDLPHRSDIRLSVYDLLGREIRTLANGYFAAGTHTIQWNGKDTAGNPAASGVYIFKLKTKDRTLHRKALLLR